MTATCEYKTNEVNKKSCDSFLIGGFSKDLRLLKVFNSSLSFKISSLSDAKTTISDRIFKTQFRKFNLSKKQNS